MEIDIDRLHSIPLQKSTNDSKSYVQNVTNIKNMSESPNDLLKMASVSTEVPLFKVCPFDESINVSKSYVCYRNEVCCAQGCCSVFSYKYFQNWHFWVMALVVFGLFYFIGRYCKKLERQRVAREERNNPRNNLNISQYASTPVSEASPRPGFDDSNVNNLLEHFFQSYNRRCHQCPASRNSGEPPPGYNIAINMPKPDPKDCDSKVTLSCSSKQVVPSTKSTSSEPTSTTASRKTTQEDMVPSYEAATGKTQDKPDKRDKDDKEDSRSKKSESK